MTRSVESDRPGDEIYQDLSRLNNELVTLQRDLSQRNAQLTAFTTELEARVLERTRHLAEANEELETLAYAMAHDLRAPARHVEAFAALLEASTAPLPPKEREWIALMRGAAARQAAIVEDILGYLRLASSRLVRQRVEPREMVLHVVEELAVLGGSNVEWKVEELPATAADPTLLRAVLRNLLSNAVKFSARARPPMVNVGARTEATRTVYFVRDNGVGFDPAGAKNLFKPFERLHGDPEFGGLGIGLAIVRRLVSRHGGHVWADSAPGRGATFSFTLEGGPA